MRDAASWQRDSGPRAEPGRGDPGRRRRILLVYPRFATNHFLNFEHMTAFYPGKRAVMPSLGLLTFGASLHDAWEARYVDENVSGLSSRDLDWADVVAVSGMHPQRSRIIEVLDAANRLGKLTVLGGPSVSICPEYYPQADVLHVGELGDGTRRMMAFLASGATKPSQQLVFCTTEKTPLDEQPVPAYGAIDVNAYLVMPVQFSVGCPYTCEFCDIPMIYGRTPRVKSPARVIRELAAVHGTGFVGTLLFVDDNLIAHRRALLDLLPPVADWQRTNRYPYPLTGEASVNVSRHPEVLARLREAGFSHLFLGVESPDPATLASISKRQNTLDPMIESVRRIQSFGMEVIMGMIFGFDTDTVDTGRQTAAFVRDANAPIVYFNLLAALPKTALWERLEAEGRLFPTGDGDVRRSDELLNCVTTNVAYRLPNETVVRMLRETIADVYSPAEVYGRFRWNAERVYGNQRRGVPPARTWAERRFLARFTVGTLWSVIWRIGVRADYRRQFWGFVSQLARLRVRGRIPSVLEVLLRVAPNAHHLIEWGRKLAGSAAVAPGPIATPAGTRDTPGRTVSGRAATARRQ